MMESQDYEYPVEAWLQDMEMSELLTENQNRKYNQIVAGYLTDQSVNSHDGVQARMSDEFVSEKMAQIKIWIQQIDEDQLVIVNT